MVRRVEGLAAKPDSLNPRNPHVEGENRLLWKEGRKEGRSVGSEGGREERRDRRRKPVDNSTYPEGDIQGHGSSLFSLS